MPKKKGSFWKNNIKKIKKERKERRIAEKVKISRMKTEKTVSNELQPVVVNNEETQQQVLEEEKEELEEKVEELEEELLMEYVAMGGGDDAEAWEWAFSHLARVHKWRKGANRVILALGDSFSHGFAHRRPFIEMEKFSHFAELHELGEMPYCFYDYLHKGWELDDIEDNYREGVQYIDNPSPMMRKLHKDPKTGRGTRPSITKQIRRIMETSRDDSPITIHSIRCGDNNISLKFMQYLSIEGGGFSLDASEVEYLVPTLLGLLLSDDSENFLSFYENFEHAFVDVSTDLFTQSLGPVTKYVTKMV